MLGSGRSKKPFRFLLQHSTYMAKLTMHLGFYMSILNQAGNKGDGKKLQV